MPITEPISVEKENGTIDMMTGMVSEDLAQELGISVEEAMARFLQSRTCATLYDRDSKLWWFGPSYIVDQYLTEMRKRTNGAE